ncbi:MAG: hypothetical protein JO008_01650 [Alphaproteobacteria bacterium]|nr:hypothetical protein [Alphaproteobacteria bacterium]
MRVKIFTDARPGRVEEQVNHWFTHEAGPIYIVKTETTAVPASATAGGTPHDSASPYIVVTIWYEPEAGS